MDLNDSFTETLLQNSKARKEYLNSKMNGTSSIARRKRTVLADENVLEDSSKRPRPNYPVENEKENASIEPVNVQDTFMPFKVSTNVRGLAAVQRKDATDAKIDVKDTTDGIHGIDANKWEAHIISSSNSSQAHSTHQTRLANLAAQINQWEDDHHQPTQASNIISLPKKTNMSSVRKIPTSNSNSISIKLFYTNTPSDSHNFGMQTASQLRKNGAFDSELGSCSMPFNLKTSNNDTDVGSVMNTKAETDQAFKVFVPNEESGKFLAKPLIVHTREKIKNCNFEKNAVKKDSMIAKKNNSKSAKQSHINSESNNIAERTHFPLSARKAFFEKAATNPCTKSSEPAFQPQLSVAQRAAMFENASKSNKKQPQVNLSLPKRIVTPLLIKTSEVGEQQVQHGFCHKTVKKFDVQSSDFSIQETISTTHTESDIPSSTEYNVNTSYVEQSLIESTVCSPKQKLVTAVINLQKEIENNIQQIIVDSSTNSLQELESTTLGKEKCVVNATIDIEQESVKKTLQQKYKETTALQKLCNESNFKDFQQRLAKKDTNNSQEAVVKSEVVQRKEISNLLNHWEKLSSNFVELNPEKESPTKQSENASLNAYVSEFEHSDCKSELEWESTDGESTSEWEYIKGESMSDYSEKKSTSKFNEIESENNVKEFCLKRNEGSTSECKNKESINDSSVADNKKQLLEQDALNHEAFLAKSGFKTSSFPASDDDYDPPNVLNWQQEVNDSKNQTDKTSWKSPSSETKNPKIFQTVLNDPTESNEIKGSSGIQEIPIGGTSRIAESPLVHTVSFYRKQKQESRRSSPMPPIKRRLSSDEENDPTQGIQKRIKFLQEEILRQQTVIGQTSQALNLCYATTEFSGSSEKIEAERLLLIANQKRLACMNEIQSLKFRGVQKEHATDGTGTLIITDLQLPLKQDFIASQLKGEISSVHCFLCLIRQGAQVIVSQMVSTSDKITNGALCFSNHVKLENLSSDFSVVFEVYTLQTSKENLSHDKKYHIRRDQSKIRLTPKGKKAESRLLRPAISSPGGPDAVRSSNFALIGYTRFTVQNSNKKCFTLDKVPFASPLEGILKVTLQLHTNHTTTHKGFLTLFEDVSGYGLWTRLWCSLHSHRLSYWKYPDDEQKKEPLGAIDLRECATGVVGPVSRDECARPNTYKIVTVRPVREGDRETLVSGREGALTRTRYLLSADTKEERIVWCNKLNEALSKVRKWDAQALRTVEDK